MYIRNRSHILAHNIHNCACITIQDNVMYSSWTVAIVKPPYFHNPYGNTPIPAKPRQSLTRPKHSHTPINPNADTHTPTTRQLSGIHKGAMNYPPRDFGLWINSTITFSTPASLEYISLSPPDVIVELVYHTLPVLSLHHLQRKTCEQGDLVVLIMSFLFVSWRQTRHCHMGYWAHERELC